MSLYRGGSAESVLGRSGRVRVVGPDPSREVAAAAEQKTATGGPSLGRGSRGSDCTPGLTRRRLHYACRSSERVVGRLDGPPDQRPPADCPASSRRVGCGSACEPISSGSGGHPTTAFPKLVTGTSIVKQRRPAACLGDPGSQHSRIVGARSSTPLHWRYRVEDDACLL
jgi:hypothetical protein